MTLARPAALASSILVAALLLAACGGDSDDPTATPTVAAGTPTATATATPAAERPSDADDASGGNAAPDGAQPAPDFPRPPEIVATAGAASAQLGLGTFCWSEPGRTLCVDSFAIATNGTPLQIAQGETVELDSALVWADAISLTVTSRPASGTPVGSDAPASALQLSVGAGSASFVADLDPGTYVISLSVRVAQGDALYGLLLEVTAP